MCFFPVLRLIKAALKHVMYPGGYGPERCELFTLFFFWTYLWARCCLVDKRGTRLEPSSCIACVKHGSIFPFSFCCGAACFNKHRNQADGAVVFCQTSLIHTDETHTQMYTRWNGFLSVWLVFDPRVHAVRWSGPWLQEANLQHEPTVPQMTPKHC